MSVGSVCRHLKIVGRIAISRFFHVVSRTPTEVATQPSETILSFGDEAPRVVPQGRTKVSLALPVVGSEIRLRLASKIDSDVSSAGDSLEAKVVRAVPDTEGGTIPVGTVIRGHLAELESVYFPPRQVAAIRFDTIVLNGAPVPLIIDPIGKTDQRGRGIFTFDGKRLVLGKEFVSRWRVRSPVNN